ncbi:hypothetical protein I4U23_030465 [Adineta vaga]|nr:hypothetical protein I4U23_030465 [Adineta vaga]
MLVSSSSNNYRMSTIPLSKTPQSISVRTRTLKRCEPAWPSRDYVRQENYARRKAQELQGWACPRTIPYQGIEPVNLLPKPPKPIVNEQSTNVTSDKITSKTSSIGSASNRPKSSPPVQDDHLMRLQYETTLRRLQTAQQQYMRKSSDILKSVRLGRSAKDVVEKISQNESSRAQSTDLNKTINAADDEKEQDVLIDRILDDFKDEDDNESSVSGIREDIMSPRTMVNTNMMGTDSSSGQESQKARSIDLTTYPVKLCHSAPPLNYKKMKDVLERPFTPCFTSLSSRLRIQNRMPFREALYRQLCLYYGYYELYVRMDREKRLAAVGILINGKRNRSLQIVQMLIHRIIVTNIEQNHPWKMLFHLVHLQIYTIKIRKLLMQLKIQKCLFYLKLVLIAVLKLTLSSDSAERYLFPIDSFQHERDLNESISSTSHQEDTIHSDNIDSSFPTPHMLMSSATSVILASNTSRTSLSSNMTQPLIEHTSTNIPSIEDREQRQSDMLIKRLNRRRIITIEGLRQPFPLPEKEIRLLRVGDSSDLNRIFSIENATSTNREQVRARQTREIKRKLVSNERRRSTTNMGLFRSKEHAERLHTLRREFDEFTEEQTTILNNKLQQIDKNRLFYYQTKLNDMQKLMPTCTLSQKLLKQLRFDKDKQKKNAISHRYQSWYVDLLEMVEPEYQHDQMISNLLKELKEYADPSHTPTVIRFRIILRDLKPHEICHPDIMAAIEFIRVHIVKMGVDEFNAYFHKQFPHVTDYVASDNNNDVDDNDETTSDV